jgi:hypothetical protein
MDIEELLDSAFPTPPGDNTIEYLCHHLNPTQMARIIHALRCNEEYAGKDEQDAAAYRELQQRIYNCLVGNCGPEDARQYLAMTEKENHE